MHSLDYDPLYLHIKPVYLDYIYTFDKYKRQGHASSLLLKIIKKKTITAFCNNDKSVFLFRKCGFSVINDLARFPPIEENNDMLLEILNNY
jgi:ribosomal protein S18 acetylase RimI-like enzyme